MTPLYTAVKRFDAADDDWPSYIAWSGLCQLRELVSLDSMLCPTWFRTLTEDDWRYNVKADFKLELFFDLDHVLARVAAAVRVNVLAVLEEPAEDEVRAFVDPALAFAASIWSSHEPARAHSSTPVAFRARSRAPSCPSTG